MPVRMPATGNFTPPPEGSFVGICCRVIDLGTQETTYQGQAKQTHQVLISWELPDELMDDGRPYMLSRSYTYSSSPKSNLRKDLESWRGKRFSDAEIEGFEIDTLLGVGCMLNVVHTEKQNGDVFANIAAIIRLPRGTKIPPPHNDLLSLSLEDRPFNRVVFEKLGDKLRDKISKSPEYRRAVSDLPPQDAPPPASQADYGSLPDDDIPF